MGSKKGASNFVNIREENFPQEDLNTLLFETIEERYVIRVKTLIDYAVQNNKPIDLKILKAAISEADPEMIEYIIPHCGFSNPSDQYIPKELVIISDKDYKKSLEVLLKWNFTVKPDSKEDEEFVYAAVENGHLPIVLQLLNFGINVNMVNSDTGLNLLTIACVQEEYEIVENLLKHNADINVITSGDNKKLNDQCKISYNLREFTRLVSLDYNKNYLYDVTCLHIAVFYSDPKMTELLLKYGAKIMNDPKFFNLAYLSIINRREDIFRIFLAYGVDATDIGFRGKTFLHACVHPNFGGFKNGHETKKLKPNPRDDIAKLLLEKGAKKHLKIPGNSLLFDAMTNQHHEIAKLFLGYKPDVQYISPNGNTVLHEAIRNYDVEFIESLLKLKPPVNIVNCKGRTPLLLACKIISPKRLEIIKALLQCNAEIHRINNSTMTPLHIACDKQWPELIQLLFEKDADPNATDDKGQTPLHYVCREQTNETEIIINLLLEHRGNIEATDERNRTPLMIACENNNYVTVELLLDKNAFVNHKDSENSTPFLIAIEKKYFDVMQCLIEYGGANIDDFFYNNQTSLIIFDKKMKVIYKKNEDIPTKMLKTLICYIVKLHVAGLKVNQRINWRTEDGWDFGDNGINTINIDRKYKAEYEEEIERMKIERIGESNITLYDLLKKNTSFLSRFVKNSNIKEALIKKVDENKFPFYINIVQRRFREANIRYEAMIPARSYSIYEEGLPEELEDLIYSFLGLDDILNLSEAFNPSRSTIAECTNTTID